MTTVPTMIRPAPIGACGSRLPASTEIDAARGPASTRRALSSKPPVLGRGVALAKYALAEADIKAGRLVPLLRSSQPVDFSYYLVAPRAKLNLPKVAHFRDWLRTQVA